MGARSSNTDRNGHRNNSENILLNGHLSYFYNSRLNSGGVSPNAAPGVPFSATGGTKDTSSRSGYTLHKFTSTGPSSLVLDGVPKAPFTTVECLIVAGGGAGGCMTGGGGGGGGGVLYWNALPISSGTIPVSVGAGGEGGNPSSSTQGLQGGDSVVVANPGSTTYTAIGGGGGCGGIQGGVPSANEGGSSGGTSAPGSPTGLNPNPAQPAQQNPVGSFTGYGNPGGRGWHTGGEKIDGGGGGGAASSGGNGQAGSYPAPGNNGGNGQPISITGSALKWAGGGGGGGHYNEGTAGNGGTGGGGGGGGNNNAGEGGTGGLNNGSDGAQSNGGAAGGDGGTNTGGGGGGDGGDNWTGQPGPEGGTGIVIFAYPGTY